jgi:hypothetical protein
VERCGGRASGDILGRSLGTIDTSNADAWGEKGKMSGQLKRLKFDVNYVIASKVIATNARQLTPTIIPGGSSNPCALIGA